MLNTQNFLKSLIMLLFTILLIVNILYAFNINATIGGTLSGIVVSGDFTDKYFGVSTFLDQWQIIFRQNQLFRAIEISLQYISRFLEKTNYVTLLSKLGTFDGLNNQASTVIQGIYFIVNALTNVLWLLGSLSYLIIFLLYVFTVIFNFFSFIMAFLSGVAYTSLPHTVFPVITTLPLV